MSNNKIENNKAILDLATNLNNAITHNGWITRYDVETDELAVSKAKISDDTRLKYFSKEISLYVNGKGAIEGFFIEYFTSNLMSHKKGSAKIISELRSSPELSEKPIIKVSQRKFSKLAPLLEEVIKESLAQNMSLNPC